MEYSSPPPFFFTGCEATMQYEIYLHELDTHKANTLPEVEALLSTIFASRGVAIRPFIFNIHNARKGRLRWNVLDKPAWEQRRIQSMKGTITLETGRPYTRAEYDAGQA